MIIRSVYVLSDFLQNAVRTHATGTRVSDAGDGYSNGAYADFVVETMSGRSFLVTVKEHEPEEYEEEEEE